MLVVKLKGPLPGVALAELPVGLIAWDDEGRVYEEWVPDEGARQIWDRMISSLKAENRLTPDILPVLSEEWINGITTDMEVFELKLGPDETADDRFAELAMELQMQWAEVDTRVREAVERRWKEQQGLEDQPHE